MKKLLLFFISLSFYSAIQAQKKVSLTCALQHKDLNTCINNATISAPYEATQLLQILKNTQQYTGSINRYLPCTIVDNFVPAINNEGDNCLLFPNTTIFKKLKDPSSPEFSAFCHAIAHFKLMDSNEITFKKEALALELFLMNNIPTSQNINITNKATNNDATNFEIDLGGGIKLAMVYIEGGNYTMGCTSEQKDCSDDEILQEVSLSSFYIGKFELTQKQWRAIMGDNPSKFNDCDDCPVEQVSWNDVQGFLQNLNQKFPSSGGKGIFRLPTEAEWEYAARERGKNVLFGNGKNIADPAEMNFDASLDYKKSYSVAGIYRAKTIAVGTFTPNSLGLYDMAGNVWEWCSDWYGKRALNSPRISNPRGESTGSLRVIRGGSWDDSPQYCRIAYRFNNTPVNRANYLGFRVALSQ